MLAAHVTVLLLSTTGASDQCRALRDVLVDADNAFQSTKPGVVLPDDRGRPDWILEGRNSSTLFGESSTWWATNSDRVENHADVVQRIRGTLDTCGIKGWQVRSTEDRSPRKSAKTIAVGAYQMRIYSAAVDTKDDTVAKALEAELAQLDEKERRRVRLMMPRRVDAMLGSKLSKPRAAFDCSAFAKGRRVASLMGIKSTAATFAKTTPATKVEFYRGTGETTASLVWQHVRDELLRCLDDKRWTIDATAPRTSYQLNAFDGTHAIRLRQYLDVGVRSVAVFIGKAPETEVTVARNRMLSVPGYRVGRDYSFRTPEGVRRVRTKSDRHLRFVRDVKGGFQEVFETRKLPSFALDEAAVEHLNRHVLYAKRDEQQSLKVVRSEIRGGLLEQILTYREGGKSILEAHAYRSNDHTAMRLTCKLLHEQVENALRRCQLYFFGTSRVLGGTSHDTDEKERRVARQALRRGAYEDAEKRARRLRDGVLLAEILRIRGRHKEAHESLDSVLRAQPKHLRARYLKGLLYRDRGQTNAADEAFRSMIDDWNDGRITDEAEPLFYLAQAARFLGSERESSALFDEAVTKDPEFREANVAWGMLFLDRFGFRGAEKSFAEVLEQDPWHPDALNGMARLVLETTYRPDLVQDQLDGALETNNRHVPSLITRAIVEIDRRDFEKAQRTVDGLLHVNPNSVEAFSLAATVHWLRGDQKAFELMKRKVLALHPKYSALFRLVARSAKHEHRYQDAIALLREALKIDPKDYKAMGELGLTYILVDDKKKGLEWLRKSSDGDSFNERVYTAIKLFEDDIPTKHVEVRTKRFRYVFPKSEAKVLERFVPEFMEAAYADMAKRYRVEPVAPTSIEFYGDQAQVRIRAHGKLTLGKPGTCLGRVVIAPTPSLMRSNWAKVMWHELAHVFTIQGAKYRVPRWFMEGVAEFETMTHQPRWRREREGDIWKMLQAGQLPAISVLDQEFLYPEHRRVATAYHLAALVIGYLVKEHGDGVIVRAIDTFAKGKSTAEMIRAITKKSVAQFDRDFAVHLERTLRKDEDDGSRALQRYENAIRAKDYEAAATALKEYVVIADEDYKAVRSLVLGLARAKRYEDVAKYGEMALELRLDDREVFQAVAEAHERLGNQKRARLLREAAKLTAGR